jgi:Tol biopolymer transport system component
MKQWSAVLMTTALLALAAVGGRAEANVPDANSQIAFARQIPTGGADVFIANPDGSGLHQVPLVYPAEDFGIPVWSPDRSQLLISLLLRFDASGDFVGGPATVDLDGSNFKVLEPPNGLVDMGCAAWTPDGSHFLCLIGGDQPGVFTIRASDVGDPVRLTSYPFGASCNACDAPTDVSPDGTRFIFLRFKNEDTKNHEQVALFVENLDGTGLRQLTPYGLAEPHEMAAAQWSPDGREIISATTHGRLFVIRPDGTGLTQIKLQTGTSKYFAFEPDWSPDGTRIVFCMIVNGQEDIYTARADGSDLVQVTDTLAVENGPDWGRSVS